MAWWCHAEACAVSPESDVLSSSPQVVKQAAQQASRYDLKPRWLFQQQLGGWRAAVAGALAAAAAGTTISDAPSVRSGKLKLLLVGSDGDLWVPHAVRLLTTRWRLIFAWREGSEARDEEEHDERPRGVCFGLGSGRFWGEEFFLLDRTRD